MNDIDNIIKWLTLISILVTLFGVVIGGASSFIKFGQQKQMMINNAKATEEAKMTATAANIKADLAATEAKQAAVELIELKGIITVKLDKLDAVKETMIRIDERMINLQATVDELRQLKKT